MLKRRRWQSPMPWQKNLMVTGAEALAGLAEG
jgi:hypothetical protein